MNKQNFPAAMRGVTLIELMVVVAIVAIMFAVAFPAYDRYIVRAKRAVGQNVLVQVADRQQQFFMDNKRYAADLTNLGFTGDPYIVDDDGASTVAGDPDAVYSVSLSNVTATSYTATAAPLSGQLSRDTSCGSLTLTQAGAKGHSGGGDNCW
jgi:type IV pilus assembly protein PilE